MLFARPCYGSHHAGMSTRPKIYKQADQETKKKRGEMGNDDRGSGVEECPYNHSLLSYMGKAAKMPLVAQQLRYTGDNAPL